MLNRAIVGYVLNTYYDSEAYQTNFERKPNADVADLLKRAEHIDLTHVSSIPVLILGYDTYDLVIMIQQPGKVEVYDVVSFTNRLLPIYRASSSCGPFLFMYQPDPLIYRTDYT